SPAGLYPALSLRPHRRDPPSSQAELTSSPPPLSDSSSSPQCKTLLLHGAFPLGEARRPETPPVKVYTSNGVEEESAEVFPER
ncbi:hypothetical protein GBF38_008614, partial [Nibea albiflora]